LNAATRTTKIIQTLFPAQIGERILKQAELEEKMQRNEASKSPFWAKSNMQDFLFESQDGEGENTCSPFSLGSLPILLVRTSKSIGSASA
jgi:hypothetical protein